MRFIILCIILTGISINSAAQQRSTLDVTGYYKLDNRQNASPGKIRGFTGLTKIKKLSPSKIIVRLNVEGAADDQGDAYLFDTLKIKNNKAVYLDLRSDSSCKVIFTFNNQGVKVEELSDDYNLNCGFGHGARVDGFYVKVNAAVPTDKELK